MSDFSSFFPAAGGSGGGGLVNTFAAISTMAGTAGTNPGFNSTTKIYTDENSGKWLQTGTTLDLDAAVAAEYPYANSKFFAFNSQNANAVSGTNDINCWTTSFLYDFQSITDFKFIAKKYRSYNGKQGFYSYNYSGAGTILHHPPSNSADTATPIPYSYCAGNSTAQNGITLTASGSNMLIQFFNMLQSNATAQSTFSTYTNGNLNNQNKVRHVYFDGQAANSNFHVVYVLANAIKLDIYASSGGTYSLSSTKTLALTSASFTVPYTGDLAASLWVVEHNASTGGFAVYWGSKVVVYSNESTITAIHEVGGGNIRSRVAAYTNSTVSVARQTCGVGTVNQYKSVIGEGNVVAQSVLTNSADSLTIFKKLK